MPKLSKKSDRFEVEKRVSEVIEMIIGGYKTKEIIKYAADKWGVGQDQTYNYIKKANTKLSERQDKTIDYYFNIQEKRLTEIYKLCFDAAFNKKKKDPYAYMPALNVLKEISELTGIKRKDVNVMMNDNLKDFFGLLNQVKDED